MNNFTFLFIVLLVAAGFANKASAGIEEDIIKCQSMQENLARLDCYDALAVHYLTILNTDVEIPANIKASANIDSIKVGVVNKAPENTVDNKLEAKIIAETADFGQSNKNKIQEIQSVMIGEFTSWKKGMKIKLENGQVWKVNESKSSYKKISNPIITITRGTFGSFDAKIEGLNARAKVRRVK